MIAHVVQRVRGDETVVRNPPDRWLHVEGMAPSQAHKLGVARDPVVRCSLGEGERGKQVNLRGGFRRNEVACLPGLRQPQA